MANTLTDIVERIKKIKGFGTDLEVADALGMSKQALYNHKNRGTIPFKAITTFCERENISLGKVFLPKHHLIVLGRAPAIMQPGGEELYLTNEGAMPLDMVCDLLEIKEEDFPRWFKTHKQQKESSDVRLKKLFDAVKNDETLAQIIQHLEFDTPELKGYILTLIENYLTKD